VRTARLAMTMGLLAIASGAFAAAGASTPTKTLASYCSPSGDVCYGAIKRNGIIRLEITTAARYFRRYTLCVKPPGPGASGYRRCGSFPIFRHGSTWSSSVRLDRFPVTEPGICRVTWKRRGTPLGPTLRFRVAGLA
jgi:hypothetical protein